VAWACESIAHSPDQRDTLAELYRVLKPGGRLIVRDIYLKRHPAGEEEARLVDAWRKAWVLPPIPSPEQFLGFVSRTGFTEVHMEDVTASGVRSGKRLYWMSMAALPGASLLHRMGIRTDVQHTNVTGSIAAWRGYLHGLWVAAHTVARRPEA
jgi:SAM-dependent methyltransferase